MVRTIILLLATWIGWRILKRWYNNSLEADYSTSSVNSTLSMMKDGGQMVRCDYCGTHIPVREATLSKIGNYCCEEHKCLDVKVHSQV